MTVLFWNFKCGVESEHSEALAALARLVAYHQVDILVIADTKAAPKAILDALNRDWMTFELADLPPKPNPEIMFFTRFSAKNLSPFRSNRRIDVRKLRIVGRQEILFAAIHFYDRRNYSPEEQASMVSDVHKILRDAEIDRKHTRTVLFGDLNMNPFEAGMIDTVSGFAAMQTRSLASRDSSPHAAGPQRFYNPSWSRLGREGSQASGTFYFPNISKPLNIFWHHLDQVLVRPGLFPAFPDEGFRILTQIPGADNTIESLAVFKEKHWSLKYSDHFPILFELDPMKEPDHA